MASFPIFMNLSGGIPPLVVGGGELALAKCRLLLRRAERVHVAADRVVPGLRELIAGGQVELLPSLPDETDIRGRPLVIAATGDDVAEDERVSTLARSLGVPVNVPDRPHLCSFALGAVVDRGSVTVAIGTEGKAPVLATRLRADLERELHPRLGRLADIADEYRGAVAETLPVGPQRRQFWDDVLSGAAGDAILAGEESRGRDAIEARLHARVPLAQTGRVILVGAGPGDPDLLTLKAVRALKSADVILHDGLMGEAVLEHARREAQIISVAKAKGQHSKSQAEINALMVALAREGKTVVRLKGGDPSIFGRAGEEVEMLRACSIPVEVIPGVTAASAAAASLQISLTHRDLARSLTFISGHAAGDGAADFDQVDFAALAERRATIAVYMGLATAPVLARQLLQAGWSPATPIIAIARVSQPAERRIATDLDALADDGQSLGLSGPTLLIIGEVASLNPSGAIERMTRALPTHQHVEVIDA